MWCSEYRVNSQITEDVHIVSSSEQLLFVPEGLEFLPRINLPHVVKYPRLTERRDLISELLHCNSMWLLYLSLFNLYPNHYIRLWKMDLIHFRAITIMWHLLTLQNTLFKVKNREGSKVTGLLNGDFFSCYFLPCLFSLVIVFTKLFCDIHL